MTTRFRPLIIAAVCCAVLIAGVANPAVAGERYFIDFRARPGVMLGHTFIVYGRLDTDGRAIDVQYAGLYPKDGGKGSFLIAPRAPIRGGVAEDFKQPASISYRRRLTATEFARLTATIRRVQQTEPYWHLLFFNCNDFITEVADALGMLRPPSLMLPRDFVAALRELNGG